MAKNKSVAKLVDELSSRISILTNESSNAILKSDSLKLIRNILDDARIVAYPTDITIEDIKLLPKKYIKKIFDIMGANEKDQKYYLSNFESNLAKYEEVHRIDDLAELDTFFMNIANMIRDYANNFETFYNNQNNGVREKVTMYQNIIDMFNNKKFNALYTNTKEIVKIMDQINLPTIDRYEVLKYIDIKNQEFSKLDNVDAKLKLQVNSLVNKYLINKDNIDKVILQSEVNIDNIDELVESISKDNFMDKNLIYNILVTIIIENLYNEYLNEENKTSKKEILKNINKLFKYIKNIDESIILKVDHLLDEKSEFYYMVTHELKLNPDDFDNLSIDDFLDKGYDFNIAIEYKTLPLIKCMSEVMDNMPKDQNDKRYIEGCSILNDLYDEYVEYKNLNIYNEDNNIVKTA